MPVEFSIESIEYLTEKLNNSQRLCDESIVYLTSEISMTVQNLLQDACKFVWKCHRKQMTTNDFSLALKLHHLQPLYGTYMSSNTNHCSFQKIRKNNRTLYQMENNILAFSNCINILVKVPIDISVHIHWLAISDRQPKTTENPVIQKFNQSAANPGSQKTTDKHSHILSNEQQIYCNALTETCICSDENKRKEALLTLSCDSSLQLIISRLVLFIAEGVRVNLRPTSTFDRSIILTFLMQMCDALLSNKTILLESYLHYLLPAILSCLLEQRPSHDHWSLRELSAKCCGRIVQKYTNSINGLQKRIINVLYPILINTNEKYNWLTIYGAFVGLCEIGPKVIVQLIFPLAKRLGENICLIADIKTSQKITQTVVQFITSAYQSVYHESDTYDKTLDEQFGSYLAPLIQHKLILLL